MNHHPDFERQGITIYHGDCLDVLKDLPSKSVQCCVTSPPYWGLRDYGVEGQLGLESTPEEYVAKMVEVFQCVKRVLRDDGALWLNMGDSYTSGGRDGWGPQTGKQQTNKGSLNEKRAAQPKDLKPKDLVGIPWRVAFALQADGWYLRQDIIWHKPNPMPESVRDRCTKAHEYIFLLSKSPRYYYDAEAIKEEAVFAGVDKRNSFKGRQGGAEYHAKSGGEGTESKIRDFRNKRSVWTVPTKPFKAAHFATFPPKLIEPCILAGCPEGGTVLDPFNGSGTVGAVCRNLGRNAIGIELNEKYCEIATSRLQQEVLF